MEHSEFEHPIDRRDSLSVKWNKEAIAKICNNGEALPFWVADLDFPSPLAVRQALLKEVEHGVFGYPKFDDLIETFTLWCNRRHRWNPDPSLTITAPGMLFAIATVVELYSKKGDAIILPTPAYKPFTHIIQNLERTITPWPMLYDSDKGVFSLDLNSLDSLYDTYKAPLLLFCSPHNPTGSVFSEEELLYVAEISAKHNALVVSDEIHADLTYEENLHIPFDCISQKVGTKSITCMAPSKTFNIAGEHFSVAVSSSKEIHLNLQRRLVAMRASGDLLATVAAIAAYKEGYEWLFSLRRFLKSQTTMISSLLSETTPYLKFIAPQASFIGLIDCASIEESVKKESIESPGLYDPSLSPEGGLLSRFFGQRAHIAMNDGSWFGRGYHQFVRFNFGTSSESVRGAILSIAEAANKVMS